MKNLIDKYNELVANNKKVNHAIVYGAVIVQSICTVLIISTSYFGGMRKGVDLTYDAMEECNEKEND